VNREHVVGGAPSSVDGFFQGALQTISTEQRPGAVSERVLGGKQGGPLLIGEIIRLVVKDRLDERVEGGNSLVTTEEFLEVLFD
jgi:hypothetical protein